MEHCKNSHLGNSLHEKALKQSYRKVTIWNYLLKTSSKFEVNFMIASRKVNISAYLIGVLLMRCRVESLGDLACSISKPAGGRWGPLARYHLQHIERSAYHYTRWRTASSMFLSRAHRKASHAVLIPLRHLNSTLRSSHTLAASLTPVFLTSHAL